jgi:hypothetical protein
VRNCGPLGFRDSLAYKGACPCIRTVEVEQIEVLATRVVRGVKSIVLLWFLDSYDVEFRDPFVFK